MFPQDAQGSLNARTCSFTCRKIPVLWKPVGSWEDGAYNFNNKTYRDGLILYGEVGVEGNEQRCLDVCVWIYKHVSLHLHAFTNVSMGYECVCWYAFAYVYVCTHTHTHTQTYTLNTQSHTHNSAVFKCVCMHTVGREVGVKLVPRLL